MNLSLRHVAAITIVPLVLVATGCGGDGLPGLVTDASSDAGAPGTGAAPATDAPQDTGAAPATDAPATTDAPETPDSGAPGTDTPATDDGSGSDVAIIVLIVVAVAALFAAIVAVTRRRPKGTTTDPRRQNLSTARWIHDQLSLEMLTQPPAAAQSRWNVERGRFDQLVIDLRATSPSQRNPAVWESLAAAVATLGSSLDTAVRVRATADADPDLAREAVAIANGHRSDLQRALITAEQSL
jgi:hypothetical protein